MSVVTQVSEQTLEEQHCSSLVAFSTMSDFLAGYQILLRPRKSNSSTTKKALKFQDIHPAFVHHWWILVVPLPPKPCSDVAVMKANPAGYTHLGQWPHSSDSVPAVPVLEWPLGGSAGT